MKTTATLIATLMLGVASCAYAQGAPGEGLGGGAGGAGGPPAVSGGAPDGGGPGGPDGGPPAAQGPRGPSEGPGAPDGPGPSAERGGPPSDASDGPRERGARQRSAEDSDAGPASKGDGPKSSRRERQADDSPKGAADGPPKKAAEGEKSRERAADKADKTYKAYKADKADKTKSKDVAKEAEDAGKQKKDDITDKAAGPEPKDDKAAGPERKDADTARAEKPDRVKQVDLSGDKRERVQAALRDKGDVKHRTDVNIDISVGRRLPHDWDFAPVPIVVVEIVPEYRDYVFVWVEDEYLICDPITYEVVAIIPAYGREHARAGSSGGGKCPARLTLSEDQEDLILRSVRLGYEVDVADLEVGWSVPSDIELEKFPAAVLSEADELSACRYFIADDQLAIVDPDEDKVVLLIDKS